MGMLPIIYLNFLLFVSSKAYKKQQRVLTN